MHHQTSSSTRMLPSLIITYSHHLLLLLFILSLLLLLRPPCTAARPPPGFPSTPRTKNNKINYTWENFQNFLNAKKGSHINGMSQLKRYFHHFGYLPTLPDSGNLTDTYDDWFESAVVRYQAKFGLRITGELDSDTLDRLMSPRCGVSDTSSLHASRNYVYFPGKPRWGGRRAPVSLTYAFSPENLIHYISISEVKGAFKRAFATWGSVIPVSFTETEYYSFADIKIGFYNGDHGDGEPFDGVLGVLAHSFSPESGRFHLDAAETWAVDFGVEKSKVAVDLESVAVHEIGHILGLGHSTDKGAVMYPSLKPRKRKLELSVDDVEGIQALYGSNPNFTIGSLLESDISSNHAFDFRISPFDCSMLIIIFILGLCL